MDIESVTVVIVLMLAVATIAWLSWCAYRNHHLMLVRKEQIANQEAVQEGLRQADDQDAIVMDTYRRYDELHNR